MTAVLPWSPKDCCLKRRSWRGRFPQLGMDPTDTCSLVGERAQRSLDDAPSGCSQRRYTGEPLLEVLAAPDERSVWWKTPQGNQVSVCEKWMRMGYVTSDYWFLPLVFRNNLPCGQIHISLCMFVASKSDRNSERGGEGGGGGGGGGCGKRGEGEGEREREKKGILKWPIMNLSEGLSIQHEEKSADENKQTRKKLR